MPAGTLDLFIEQGATYEHTLTYREAGTDPLNPANPPGALVNLTDYTARAQIRETVQSQQIIASLTTENGGIVLGGALGTIKLFVSATGTAGMVFVQGVWDLELVKTSDGAVTRLLEGSVTLDPEVTR